MTGSWRGFISIVMICSLLLVKEHEVIKLTGAGFLQSNVTNHNEKNSMALLGTLNAADLLHENQRLHREVEGTEKGLVPDISFQLEKTEKELAANKAKEEVAASKEVAAEAEKKAREEASVKKSLEEAAAVKQAEEEAAKKAQEKHASQKAAELQQDSSQAYPAGAVAASITEKEMDTIGSTGSNALPLKIAIYMTTHYSSQHIQFLKQCWSAAVQRLSLLQQAELIVFDSSGTVNPKNDNYVLNLGFRNVTIHRYKNPGKQLGAIQAMTAPFLPQNQWFKGYDWILRVNPDVLFRKDQWLLQQMTDPNIDGIGSQKWKLILTDFHGFRPEAINGTTLIQKRSEMSEAKCSKKNNNCAESHATAGYQEMMDHNRLANMPNCSKRYLRHGGGDCAVIHDHGNRIIHRCPNYF